MPREPQAERERRPPAIGADDDGSGERSLTALPCHHHAADSRSAASLARHGATHRDRRLERAARRDRRIDEDRVELAPHDRAAVPPARITSNNPVAALAGHDHPVDAPAARLDLCVDAQPPQNRERSRIDRVAAQLVARKRGAIENHDARAGTRRHQPGDRAGRSRADHEDVRRGR